MLRNLFVGLIALSTSCVAAPAVAQTMETSAPMTRVSELESWGLDMPLTKVSELEKAAPVQPEVPEMEKSAEEALHYTPLGDGFLQTYGFEGAVEFNSFESTFDTEPAQKLEPVQVKAVEPSQPLLEPSRVVQKKIVNIAQNNIKPFKRKRPVFKTAPTPKVSLAKTAVGLKEIPREPKSNSKVLGTAYSSRHEVAALVPETAFGFSQVNRVSGQPVHLPMTAFSRDRATTMTNIPTNPPPSPPPSQKAADLGGAIDTGEVQEQAAKVETQPAPKPEPVSPKISISGGVSGIGASPTIETSLGLEYEGLSATLSRSRPLDAQRQSEIGLDVTLPISEQSKLTISAAQLNIDPTISATVESKITEKLTASASFNNINKTDFSLELAANYQIDARWAVNGSFNATTHQLNLGASHVISKGVEATVKVENIAATPQLGAGLSVELSPSTKLELNANDITGATTFGVKVTQTINF
jgi:hypothetical protein